MDDVNAAPEPSGSEPDPVALIERQLEREAAPPTLPSSQKPDPEPEPEEMPEPEPGPEAPPEEEDGGEDDDGEPEPEEAPSDEPELFEVKLGDRVEKVTKDELLRGYQRQSDYSRRMNELAETRRAAEAETQRVAAERQHYATQLDQVAVVLQASLPPRPDQAMLDADPIGYMQAKEAWESRVGQLQNVLAERDRAQQHTHQQMQAMQQQTLAQARERLVEMLPEWKEPEKARTEQRKVAEYLKGIGYADAEIAQAADPRAIVMARKAMLYDQLQASKPQIQQRVATAPKMVRPGASGPPPDKQKSITQQIRRSGGKDLDAVARLIELG
jgi:hypothetical protein